MSHFIIKKIKQILSIIIILMDLKIIKSQNRNMMKKMKNIILRRPKLNEMKQKLNKN